MIMFPKVIYETMLPIPPFLELRRAQCADQDTCHRSEWAAAHLMADQCTSSSTKNAGA